MHIVLGALTVGLMLVSIATLIMFKRKIKRTHATILIVTAPPLAWMLAMYTGMFYLVSRIDASLYGPNKTFLYDLCMDMFIHTCIITAIFVPILIYIGNWSGTLPYSDG